jgi:hypothetical protein
MATTTNFNDMLKRYQPYELLNETLKRKNYFWNKVKKKEDWVGGTLDIPFEGGEASSLSFGELTAASDVAQGTYVLGSISSQPELWGTMKFYEKDLDRHGDLEKSFLSLIGNKTNQFVERMSERVSMMLLGDGAISAGTANGEADGELTVANPERFTIGEKVYVDDGDSSAVAGYVRSINMETKKITLYDARTGGAVVDLSGYTTAQSVKVYLPGAQASGFSSLKSQLLSAANGGAATLFGQTKLAYPFLQAQQHAGSGITSSNILEKLFDAYYDTVSLGKGNPTEVLVSFKHFKNIAKILEAKRDFVTADKKSGYGWRSVDLIGPEGAMTITALRDMQDSEAFVMDWDSLCFHGDKFFERKRHLDGNEYFMIRETSGYQYVTDIKFYGDLVVSKPSHCGVIHGISY